MSGPYFFGVGRGKVNETVEDEVEAIAAAHGAEFTNVCLPGEGWRYWFGCPNRGSPFDESIAREVLDAVDDAGIELP